MRTHNVGWLTHRAVTGAGCLLCCLLQLNTCRHARGARAQPRAVCVCRRCAS